jgi:hypothetical protein
VSDALRRRLHFYAGNCYRLATIPWRQHRIELSEARTIFGCSFGDDGWHHLRKTLEEYDADPAVPYTHTTLYRYLTRFRPSSICDLLPAGACAGAALPLFVYPWGTFRKGDVGTRKDAHTSRFCGPSSDVFVAEEFDRTIRLYRQLKQSGYQPWRYGNTFIGGTLLRTRDGERRFVVLQGNHRLAVFAHLGMRRIAVRDVPGYLAEVREDDVDRWPLVAQGACPPETARQVFRLYFAENGRHVLRNLERAGGNHASV